MDPHPDSNAWGEALLSPTNVVSRRLPAKAARHPQHHGRPAQGLDPCCGVTLSRRSAQRRRPLPACAERFSHTGAQNRFSTLTPNRFCSSAASRWRWQWAGSRS